ncbi:30S ribosomal protein S4e [Candidatus Woesearchaeota archaeon]|jgi:small subunit ribosomal protein S4e|nr:30S ribosomal protein S4e [Candidatus Woesearchaeota archaeon]MBT5397329.1 30S ribosomal protein S4e [Candidatus Woesearchaeota archaeon]MBT5924447.1 30S ribosomal protein S4e [Candidatus Woesearchaeota archaeon]MBT6367826.1 30S ribosomal protein S4e [Candidatus Woesearchaeota archaeon]MBT7762729.1 30S ribosomal protein S4e [Candidatus Woesearchaeota archaeon]
MKNHLKRIASPRTWLINRKSNTFITRPKPGAHSFEHGISLGVILRDMLHVASTMSEAKKILNSKNVLVDGSRVKDHRRIVGLFDVISLPDIEKQYRIVLDIKGRLELIEIDAKESTHKICKIVGKTILKKGKIQFNLHDGKNIISDKDARVGDSFVVTLPTKEVESVLSLNPGATIFLIQGKHSGDVGVLKEFKDNNALYTKDNVDVETAKGYLFVVGLKGKTQITLRKE